MNLWNKLAFQLNTSVEDKKSPCFSKVDSNEVAFVFFKKSSLITTDWFEFGFDLLHNS